jgi:hypothetical protein
MACGPLFARSLISGNLRQYLNPFGVLKVDGEVWSPTLDPFSFAR